MQNYAGKGMVFTEIQCCRGLFSLGRLIDTRMAGTWTILVTMKIPTDEVGLVGRLGGGGGGDY